MGSSHTALMLRASLLQKRRMAKELLGYARNVKSCLEKSIRPYRTMLSLLQSNKLSSPVPESSI